MLFAGVRNAILFLLFCVRFCWVLLYGGLTRLMHHSVQRFRYMPKAVYLSVFTAPISNDIFSRLVFSSADDPRLTLHSSAVQPLPHTMQWLYAYRPYSYRAPYSKHWFVKHLRWKFLFWWALFAILYKSTPQFGTSSSSLFFFGFVYTIHSFLSSNRFVRFDGNSKESLTILL